MRTLMAAVVLIGVVVVDGLPTIAADLELGQKVFAAKCAMCHGVDGKGNAKMAAMMKMTIPDLSAAATKADAELVKLVSDGKKPMPSFGGNLSKEELDAVVHYAKALGRGAVAGK